MRRNWIIATLGLIACARAMAQKPTPDQQKSVLDTAREHAIHYTSKLPDFICTKQVVSAQSAPGQKKIDRLTIQLGFNDMPKESGILQSSVQVDYDFITVAGNSYLLPSRSDSGMERGFRKIGNTVTFTGYRKFEADSTIDFKE